MRLRLFSALLMTALCSSAEVYSPVVTKAGQVDTSSLQSLVRGIYEQAKASTDREKAEAIWRFFLTDGRYVKPGMIYHIAGWAYEEPKGEVLDPIKLLNSYGFGLCYHIGPLLEAVFEAGGFADARVWFLTGHTVAEVFYDGGYHYFDSDMLGYNPIGSGPLKQRPVASVRQIEQDGNIILGNLSGPKQVNPAKVDYPWYPADVHANAIPGLAELFTTKNDNWVYPFTRYAAGHTMDYTLRPGERMIRYFHPADDRLYYLPWANDGKNWREFPQELKQYNIKTTNGPVSQKDSRRWGTGRIEYHPAPLSKPAFVIDMPSPYVVMDAAFTMEAEVPASDKLVVETSTDGGRKWIPAGTLAGPHKGPWRITPAVIAQSKNGKLTSVSGTYGYQVRFTSSGSVILNLLLATDFQVNPRTLPEITPGRNEMQFRSSTSARKELPVRADEFRNFAERVVNAEYVEAKGQGWVRNSGGAEGEVIFRVEAAGSAPLAGIDVGGRFLDLRDGLAPDKLTAETRKVEPWPARDGAVPSASISWSLSANGPWQTIWTYDPKLRWKDGEAIDRTLRWPEVQKQVQSLPPHTGRVFVRYKVRSMAIDDFRLAYTVAGLHPSSPMLLTHVWTENGVERRHVERIDPEQATAKAYTVQVGNGVHVENQAIILESPLPAEPR